MIDTRGTDPASSLLEAERRIVDAQERHDALGRRKAALDIELQSLHAELDDVVRQLEALGRRRVEIGDWHRITPISPVWGQDRGIPIDRHYIHGFLDRHRGDVKGRVIEIKDPGYADMFGDGRVTTVDVLDVNPANARATIVADLSCADAVPPDTYDCFILTQTLGVVYDVAGALRHAVRMLRPGGVLLCTVPASGRISYEEGLDGDYWRFTEASIRRLFSEVLPPEAFEITGHGNVLAGAAFLYGLAVHELTREELDAYDPYFPVVYTVRAVKPASAGARQSSAGGVALRSHASTPAAAVLTYHRVGDRAHDGDSLCVPASEFERQMRHLRDGGYEVVPLHQLVRDVGAGTLTRPAVSLTFDDGYHDACSQVTPMLESFGFPATFFVVGAALDHPYEFWWDAVDRILLSGLALPDRLTLTVSGHAFDLPTASHAERITAHADVCERMYPLDHEARDAAVRALIDWSGAPAAGSPLRRPMTAAEVVWLASRPGMHVGAHSQHHEQVPRLPHAEKVADLRACRTRLESLVGRPVTALSYPYGYADADTVEAAREAGFQLAVTTESRALAPGDDPLRLPRFDAGSGGSQQLQILLRDLRP